MSCYSIVFVFSLYRVLVLKMFSQLVLLLYPLCTHKLISPIRQRVNNSHCSHNFLQYTSLSSSAFVFLSCSTQPLLPGPPLNLFSFLLFPSNLFSTFSSSFLLPCISSILILSSSIAHSPLSTISTCLHCLLHPSFSFSKLFFHSSMMIFFFFFFFPLLSS